MTGQVTEQDIIHYYDSCEGDYALLWHLGEQHAMHYGYWKEDTGLLRDALRNMNECVLGKLEIQSGDHLLDAGCGIGGTALYAAKRWNCSVTGITLSKKQCEKARTLAERKSLKGSVTFAVQNYCQTSFKDGQFQGIYGIESICHADSKRDFLQEAFRLLAPGGRLVVADFFKTERCHAHPRSEWVRKWADTWAIPDFAETHAFIQDASAEGFQMTSNEDITQNIYKSARRLYHYFFPGIVCHNILRLLGLRNRAQGKNMWSTYYQFKSLQKQLWEYRVMVFLKSTGHGKT